MAEPPVRILYMEDDAGLAQLFRKKLERAGYVVDLASDGEEGLRAYASGQYDIVAVDHTMPVYDGLEVIRRLSEKGPLPALVMITGSGNEQIAVRAMKLGAQDYVVKDVDAGYLELLPTVMQRVLEQRRLREEKEKAEAALRQYAAELEARNAELDAFAHTVAHDLKNPLSGLIALVSVLQEQDTQLSPQQRLELHQSIVGSARKMTKIIDELLLLASVRAKEQVTIEPLDMSELVQDALDRLAYLVAEHGARIELPPAWPVVVGYGPWVADVWLNYISNAIKYGGCPPRVELGAQRAEKDMVQFWVRDNGPGISPDEQSRLFAPFTRLDRVRAQGHGLGLSIARRIVEKLGGQVGVYSDLGQGSTFWFTLPSWGSDPKPELRGGSSGQAHSCGG